MPRFSVDLMRTRRIIEQASIEIEAATAAEAIEQAREDSDLEWTGIDQETDEATGTAKQL